MEGTCSCCSGGLTTSWFGVDAPTACCDSFVGSTRCDDQILPCSHDLWGQHLPTRLWQSLLLNDWCKHGKGWPRSWSPSSLLTACLLLAADFRTISCQFAANFVWDIGTALRIQDAVLREKLRDQCSHLFCCWFCTFLPWFLHFFSKLSTSETPPGWFFVLSSCVIDTKWSPLASTSNIKLLLFKLHWPSKPRRQQNSEMWNQTFLKRDQHGGLAARSGTEFTWSPQLRNLAEWDWVPIFL